MLLAAKLAVMICLCVVAFQDFRHRAVSWLLIPVLFFGFVFIAIQITVWEDYWKELVFNSCFVLVQLVLLTMYMSVKNKKLVNIVNSFLGIGDILFFIVLAAAFSPFNFVTFYLVSTILTLLGYGIFVFVKKVKTEIPLAGAMASMLLVLMILNFCMPNMNLHSDNFIIFSFIE